MEIYLQDWKPEAVSKYLFKQIKTVIFECLIPHSPDRKSVV